METEGNVSCQLGESKSKKEHEDALSLTEEYGKFKENQIFIRNID